jgi:hypothetical protein
VNLNGPDTACLLAGTDHSNDFEHAWLALEIEEGFLDCVARLVRRNERGRKGSATPLGMTRLGSWPVTGLAKMSARRQLNFGKKSGMKIDVSRET